MNFIQFKNIIDNICRDWRSRFIPTLYPNGLGEPTLNKDLVKMLRYAKEKLPNTDIILYTNGSKFDYETQYKLKNIIKRVVYSVDGFGKKDYETLRKGLNWGDILTNILYSIHWHKIHTTIRYTKYKKHKNIGKKWRDTFPTADSITGRMYGEYGNHYHVTLPCPFFKTHIFVDVDNNLKACCMFVKDVNIGNVGKCKNIIKYWNKQAKKYRKVKEMDNMLTGCDLCFKDKMWSDDKHD